MYMTTLVVHLQSVMTDYTNYWYTTTSCQYDQHCMSLYTCRYESHSGGEREIQRTLLELLNQLDGFDSRGDVKVIMATNRIETLDPALIRPGTII